MKVAGCLSGKMWPLADQKLDGHCRYLPLPMLGRAVGITGEDFEVAMKAWNVVNEALLAA